MARKAQLRPDSGVSIVVITHRKGYLLRSTLEALARECARHPSKPSEVLVVDDGGFDYGLVRELLPAFEPAQASLRYIRVKHRGYRLSLMRNLGLQLASYEPVILLDGDCRPVEGWLAAYLRAFKPGRLLAGRVEWSHPSASSSPDRLRNDSRFDYERKRPQPGLFRGQPPVYPQRFWAGNVGGLWSDWLRIGLFNEEFNGGDCEEADAGWRAYYSGLAIEFLFDACVVHQWHPTTRPRGVNWSLLERKKREYSRGRISSRWTPLEECADWEELTLGRACEANSEGAKDDPRVSPSR